MSPGNSHDGSYIQEIPAGVRVIHGVSTSVAAFIGYTGEGSVDEPALLFSWLDFERKFGAAATDLSSAVAQFFMAGGNTAWIVRVAGQAEGKSPTAADLVGTRADRTGMYALDAVDLFNLLLIPGTSDPMVHSAMTAYAESRRAFAILDLPSSCTTIAQAQSWATAAPKSANAAAYFPRLLFADPARPGEARAFANSGAIAGVFARTDVQLGVWKAPSGMDATISGAWGVEQPMTDDENGLINPLGLNALRQFPNAGTVVWGSRTLMGADSAASDWKYVPVRRTFVY